MTCLNIYYFLMTAFSTNVWTTNRMNNVYKKTLMPFKHRNQHGPNVAQFKIQYTLPKLQCIKWRTHIIYHFNDIATAAILKSL